MSAAILLVTLFLAVSANYFLYPKVQITRVDSTLAYSGISPQALNETFFMTSAYPSGGQTFAYTLELFSIPTLPQYHIESVSVNSSSPSMLYFSIASINETLPAFVSPQNPTVSILLTIKVPNTNFKGPLFVNVVLGP